MINYIIENGAAIVTGIVALMTVAKVVVNLTPSIEDNRLFGRLDNLLDAIIPNYVSQKEKKDEGNATK